MSATEYAASVAAGRTEFSWGALQAAAFARHPVADVLEAADDDLRTPRRRGGLLVGLLVVLLDFIPVIAGAILLVTATGRAGGDLTISAIVASALTLVYIVSRPVVWARALAHREAVSPRRWILALVDAAAAALTAIGLAVAGSLIELWGLWVAVMAVSAVVSVVTAVVLPLAVRRGAPLFTTATPYERARAAVEALPPATQDQIRDDLSRALTALADAGAIAPDTADAARTVPLGALTRWAWAREQPSGRTR